MGGGVLANFQSSTIRPYSTILDIQCEYRCLYHYINFPDLTFFSEMSHTEQVAEEVPPYLQDETTAGGKICLVYQTGNLYILGCDVNIFASQPSMYKFPIMPLDLSIRCTSQESLHLRENCMSDSFLCAI